jgi:hypothetical protein
MAMLKINQDPIRKKSDLCSDKLAGKDIRNANDIG